jgi:hypothetical protein
VTERDTSEQISDEHLYVLEKQYGEVFVLDDNLSEEERNDISVMIRCTNFLDCIRRGEGYPLNSISFIVGDTKHTFTPQILHSGLQSLESNFELLIKEPSKFRNFELAVRDKSSEDPSEQPDLGISELTIKKVDEEDHTRITFEHPLLARLPYFDVPREDAEEITAKFKLAVEERIKELFGIGDKRLESKHDNRRNLIAYAMGGLYKDEYNIKARILSIDSSMERIKPILYKLEKAKRASIIIYGRINKLLKKVKLLSSNETIDISIIDSTISEIERLRAEVKTNEEYITRNRRFIRQMDDLKNEEGELVAKFKQTNRKINFVKFQLKSTYPEVDQLWFFSPEFLKKIPFEWIRDNFAEKIISVFEAANQVKNTSLGATVFLQALMSKDIPKEIKLKLVNDIYNSENVLKYKEDDFFKLNRVFDNVIGSNQEYLSAITNQVIQKENKQISEIVDFWSRNASESSNSDLTRYHIAIELNSRLAELNGRFNPANFIDTVSESSFSGGIRHFRITPREVYMLQTTLQETKLNGIVPSINEQQHNEQQDRKELVKTHVDLLILNYFIDQSINSIPIGSTREILEEIYSRDEIGQYTKLEVVKRTCQDKFKKFLTEQQPILDGLDKDMVEILLTVAIENPEFVQLLLKNSSKEQLFTITSDNPKLDIKILGEIHDYCSPDLLIFVIKNYELFSQELSKQQFLNLTESNIDSTTIKKLSKLKRKGIELLAKAIDNCEDGKVDTEFIKFYFDNEQLLKNFSPDKVKSIYTVFKENSKDLDLSVVNEKTLLKAFCSAVGNFSLLNNEATSKEFRDEKLSKILFQNTFLTCYNYANFLFPYKKLNQLSEIHERGIRSFMSAHANTKMSALDNVIYISLVSAFNTLSRDQTQQSQRDTR